MTIDDIDIESIYWRDCMNRGHTTYWRDIKGVDNDESTGKTVFWEGTPRDILGDNGYTDIEGAAEDDGWIVDIINKFGFDTYIYRADFVLPEGEYTTSPISEKEAIISWLICDGGTIKIITDTAGNNYTCSGNMELTPVNEDA